MSGGGSMRVPQTLLKPFCKAGNPFWGFAGNSAKLLDPWNWGPRPFGDTGPGVKGSRVNGQRALGSLGFGV